MRKISILFMCVVLLTLGFYHDVSAYDECSYSDHSVPCTLPGNSSIILDSVMGNTAGMVGYFVGACYEETDWYDGNGNLYADLQALENPIPEGCAYYHASKSYLWLSSSSVFGGFGGANFLQDSGFFWITATPELSLNFPLSGLTAYTAPVSAIFDHTGPMYRRDGIITAFDGEVADIRNDGWCYTSNKPINKKNFKSCKVAGYKEADGSVFFNGKINYNDVYLYYDGHSGYDYTAVFGTQITAAADGILCAATYKNTYDGINVWRNPEKCPYGHDPINGPAKKDSWNYWHALYIVHPIEDYTSWYLHSSSLDPEIYEKLIQYGYADVTKALSISRVGHTGLPSGDHLHFEVRHGDATGIDPYGYGTDPALWEIQ